MEISVPYFANAEELKKMTADFAPKSYINKDSVKGFTYASRNIPGAYHEYVRSLLALMLKVERERQKDIGGPVEFAAVFAGLFREKFSLFSFSPVFSEEPKWKAADLFPFVYEEILKDIGKITAGPPRVAFYRLYRWLFSFYQYIAEKDKSLRYYASLSNKEKRIIDSFSSFWNIDEEFLAKLIIHGVLNGLAYFVIFLEHLWNGTNPGEASLKMREGFDVKKNKEIEQILSALGEDSSIIDDNLGETMGYFARYPEGEKEMEEVEERGNIYHFVRAIPYIEAYKKKLLKKG